MDNLKHTKLIDFTVISSVVKYTPYSWQKKILPVLDKCEL